MTGWHKILGAMLGLWLVAVPVTFGYQSVPLLWSNVICGLLLVFAGPFIPILIYGVVGFWLNLAPLVLWAPDAVCYYNDTIVSLILLCFFIPVSGALKVHPVSPSIPPGLSYNPSSWPQRLPVAILALLAWMISRYLAAYQLGYIDTVWDPFFADGTERVLTSSVSRAFPVADAGLGAFAYTLEMLSVFMGDERRWRTMPWMVLVFGILTVPVSLVSVVLIILQPLVVGAWCTLCLITAVCMLVGIPLAITEVMVTLHYLRGNWKALFRGGECRDARVDPAFISLDGPLLPIFQAMRRGITIPWNLALCAVFGAGFMVIPGYFGFEGILAELDRIFGALIVVVSVIAFANIARSVRWVNILLVIPLLAAPLFDGNRPVVHLGMAMLVVLLSIFPKNCHNTIYQK